MLAKINDIFPLIPNGHERNPCPNKGTSFDDDSQIDGDG